MLFVFNWTTFPSNRNENKCEKLSTKRTIIVIVSNAVEKWRGKKAFDYFKILQTYISLFAYAKAFLVMWAFSAPHSPSPLNLRWLCAVEQHLPKSSSIAWRMLGCVCAWLWIVHVVDTIYVYIVGWYEKGIPTCFILFRSWFACCTVWHEIERFTHWNSQQRRQYEIVFELVGTWKQMNIK